MVEEETAQIYSINCKFIWNAKNIKYKNIEVKN